MSDEGDARAELERATAAGYLRDDGTVSGAGWDFIGSTLLAFREHVGNPTSAIAVELVLEMVTEVAVANHRLDEGGDGG